MENEDEGIYRDRNKIKQITLKTIKKRSFRLNC
jgi:hypothetical protein